MIFGERRICPAAILISAAFLFSRAVIAGETNADKSQYTLFNPTPRELMREMSTDRPDLTESPFTVDAGHFQIEMDVVKYSYDRHNYEDLNVEAASIAPMNLKIGLCNQLDLQLMIEPWTYVRARDRSANTTEKNRGFGDITSRLKFNVWGNDDGPTALGLMPFVKFPSNQDDLGNNSVEGGLIIPFAAELPAEWGFGAMLEVDMFKDGDNNGYHPEFVSSFTFSHEIAGRLGGYMEFFNAISAEAGARWLASVDFGFTYGLSDDLQLDAGINIGVTRSADDFNPFLGISWRY